MTELAFQWTQEQGDRYRANYDKFTFEQKQQIQNLILSNLQQIPDPPVYLRRCLNSVPLPDDVVVLELGGYDGTQALEMLSVRYRYRWLNYDISRVSQYFTKPRLSMYRYTFHLLEQPFIDTEIDEQPTVFYTSKTLEHFRFSEMKQIVGKMKDCPFQVHLIDWFWRDDTHVVEENMHKELVRHLKVLGYEIHDAYIHPERSHVFAVKKWNRN